MPENKDSKETPRHEDFHLWIREMFDKNTEKKQNLKKILQKEQKREDKKNLIINRLKILLVFLDHIKEEQKNIDYRIF